MNTAHRLPSPPGGPSDSRLPGIKGQREAPAAAPLSAETEPPIYATLMRGRIYYLGSRGKVFMAGKPQAVTAAEHAWLEEHAWDSVTVEGQIEERQKFVFRATPEAPQPPRRRVRPG